jgi:L-iditol 2-dehydrogenase
MRAAVCFAANDLRVVDRPLPPLETGDALVTVDAAGICGTDVRILQGKKTRGVAFPRILGHEVAGRWQQEGTERSVAVLPTITCGECWACAAGREHLCLRRASLGYAHDGGFAQSLRVPAQAVQRNVLPLPAGMPALVGALVEPLACCLLAQRMLEPFLEDLLLVLGAGPMGLLHLLLARKRGLRVLVSEPRAERRARAEALGAEAVFAAPGESLRELILAHTDGRLPAAVLVATASPEALAASLFLARRGGAVHLFAGYDDEAPLDMRRVHNDDIRVLGHSGYDLQDAHEAVRLLAQGKVDAQALITHRFPLAQIHEALETVTAKKGCKVLIEPQVGL